jgi:mRNA export factor
VKWSHNNRCLISGSWDNTIKFWDVKSNKCIHTYKLDDKVVCMDVKNDFMVVATADKMFTTFDLNNPSKPLYTQISPLRYQTRCISIFSGFQEGFVAGSTEGRCAVQYFQDTSRNFCFKCHRQGNSIFPVNSIDFNEKYGTFVTGGGGKSFILLKQKMDFFIIGTKMQKRG